MKELFSDMETVCAHIDDLLIITNKSYGHHLEKLDEVLKRLKEAWLKVNLTKSFLVKQELEYLGYWITRQGIKPLTKKVDAIHKLKAPTTRNQLRSFISIVNYYQNMWKGRADLIAPLTALTSDATTCK